MAGLWGLEMDQNQLAQWASQARPELTAAVAADIRDHFAAIPSRDDICGYAILPGDPSTSANGIRSLAAAYNRTGDISVGPDESDFIYYKYSVDEWQHRDHGKFRRSDSALASLNAQFSAAHQKDADDFEIDDLEDAYSRSLLTAILDGLATAKSEGCFGPAVEFLAIWISDSDDPILQASSHNVEQFMREFAGSG